MKHLRKLNGYGADYAHQVADLTEKVNFFVRSSLPPIEGIFYDGQIFDASLKDAGKKLFAYIRMQETSAQELLNNIR